MHTGRENPKLVDTVTVLVCEYYCYVEFCGMVMVLWLCGILKAKGALQVRPDQTTTTTLR